MGYKHTFLTKDGPTTKYLTGMKAIRQKCLECMGWQQAEVARCKSEDCALHCFRFGRSPRKNATG